MFHDSKEKMRQGARKGARKRAMVARRRRRVEVRRALEQGAKTVREIAEATGRSEAVVRAALAELDNDNAERR